MLSAHGCDSSTHASAGDEDVRAESPSHGIDRRSRSATPNRYGYYSSSSSSSGEGSDSGSIEETSPETSPASTSKPCAWGGFKFGRLTNYESPAPLPSLRNLGLLAGQVVEEQADSPSTTHVKCGSDSLSWVSQDDFYSIPASGFVENQLGLGTALAATSAASIDSARANDGSMDDARSQCSSQMQISSGSPSPVASRSSTPGPAVIGAWPGSPAVSERDIVFSIPAASHEPEECAPPVSSAGRESGRSHLGGNDFSFPPALINNDTSSPPWRVPASAAFISATSHASFGMLPARTNGRAPLGCLSGFLNPWSETVGPYAAPVMHGFAQAENVSGTEQLQVAKEMTGPQVTVDPQAHVGQQVYMDQQVHMSQQMCMSTVGAENCKADAPAELSRSPVVGGPDEDADATSAPEVVPQHISVANVPPARAVERSVIQAAVVCACSAPTQEENLTVFAWLRPKSRSTICEESRPSSASQMSVRASRSASVVYERYV